MEFADRFINLLLTDTLTPLDDLTGPLQSALTVASRGPMTLYIGRTCWLRESVTIPANFEVLFAPGAVILLAAGVELRILGSVDLEAGHHFALSAGAHVILMGPLEAVYPEWWGGSPRQQLEAAVAMVSMRLREGASLVPIALLGPYPLDATFTIQPSGSDAKTATVAGRPVMTFVFDGRFPRGDAVLEPTFGYAVGVEQNFPLVRVPAGVNLQMRCVGFEGARGVVATDAFDVVLSSDSSDYATITLDRCSFFVHDSGALSLATMAPRAGGSPRLPDVVLKDCWFYSEAVQQTAERVTMIRSTEGIGVRLRAEGCSFVGPARSVLAIPHGHCEVTNCDFANRDGSSAVLGVDIRVGPEATSSTDGLSAREAPEGAPASVVLHETHVRSRSFRHLLGSESLGASSVYEHAGGLVLTGFVQHTLNPGESDPRPENQLAPFVEWRSLRSPLLQGSYFQTGLMIWASALLDVANVFDGGARTLGGSHLRKYPDFTSERLDR